MSQAIEKLFKRKIQSDYDGKWRKIRNFPREDAHKAFLDLANEIRAKADPRICHPTISELCNSIAEDIEESVKNV